MSNADLETSGFAFLERAIEILAVEDEYSVAAANAEFLSSYKLYNVTCASSAKEAEAHLSSSRRFHVCLFDLGITDINNDEFYLLKKYSSEVSFIVVSGRDSLEKGFYAGKYGAQSVIQKPLDHHIPELFDSINEAYFRGLIIPINLIKCKRIIRDAVEALFIQKPQDIKRWASSIGIEARYLRKVWSDCFEYQPKLILRLFEICSQIFSYYNFVYCKEFGIKKGESETTFDDIEFIKDRFKLLYSSHKKAIQSIFKRKVLIA